MKKSLKIIALVLAVVFVTFCAVNMQNQRVVEAYNTEASYITIKNNTAFTLENVHVIYNRDKELEVGEIRAGILETAEILPDDRRITEVKITGETPDGKKFFGTFSGIVNNDTLLKVDMDENFSLFVTANIDDFDY